MREVSCEDSARMNHGCQMSGKTWKKYQAIASIAHKVHLIRKDFPSNSAHFLPVAFWAAVDAVSMGVVLGVRSGRRTFGDLAGLLDLGHRFDDTDGNGLSHVADGETSKRWVVGERLNAHWLGGNHLNDSGIAIGETQLDIESYEFDWADLPRLDELGVVLDRLAGATINLLQELRELAGDVGSVAIEHWCVTGTDLARVIEDNDLSVEGLGTLGGIVLGVTSNVATTDLLDGDVLDVEANIISGKTLGQLFVVHLNGLDFSGHTSGSKGDDHAGFDGTSLNTTDRHRANTTDLVDILKGETKWLVGGTSRRVDVVNGIEKSLASDLGLGLLLPTLVPGAVARDFKHVVAVEARDGDEGNLLRVVANLLDEVGGFLDDLVEAILRPLGSVHLVDGDDELSYTQSKGEQSVLTGLAILGDTSFEFTGTGSNDEDSAVSLGGASDHVLDEIAMTRGV